MIIRRPHLRTALNWTTEDIMSAEEDGMPVQHRGNGNSNFYFLVDVMEYLKEIEELTLDNLRNIIRVAALDARNKQTSDEFDITEALRQLADGELPEFPDAKTAQTLSVAHKNFEDARTKEQDRRTKGGELVDKTIVMTQVNRVATLYEEKFGEAMFRKLERLADDATGAIETGTFYEFIREQMAEEHDECVDEVNRIEAGLQDSL